ncbi:hypothetical protein H2204_002499 [Knufia peltigerae]|uniref:Uncharacterized protein n=1 Tax=Knufia peltigerae TaxID=1002370 RepID=A0AA38YCI4_9EURO|nr:hypothetical protein H2204_002499 [Knufia peltigerae]
MVAARLGEEENGPWLLIVDNVDDADLALGFMPWVELDVHDDALMKQLMDYLPLTLDAARRLLIKHEMRTWRIPSDRAHHPSP